MRQFRTHYDNLSVSRTAPGEVIKAAYRTLAAKHHPDRNPGSSKATDMMGLLNESFAVLSDEHKRAEHDRWIERQEKADMDQLLANTREEGRRSAPLHVPPPQPPVPVPAPAPVAQKKIKKTNPLIWLALHAAVLISALAVFFLFFPAKPVVAKAPPKVENTPVAEIKARDLLGKISVQSNPAGAKITVDSHTGIAPFLFSRLTPGTHKVTLQADGYEDWTSEVRVVADQVMELNVALVPALANSTLIIFTNPTGAWIELDGPSKATGLAPMKFENLRAGRYNIVIKSEGFGTDHQVIDLAEGETKSFSFSFLPATVMVTSNPSGADVIFAGRVMGRTPLTLNSASTGRQSVELRLDGFRPVTLEDNLLPGQSLALFGKLDPRESPVAGSPWIVPIVDLEMTPLRKGSFVMGDAKGLPDEKPAHRVEISHDYWLGKYLVTQKQWVQVMGGNPSEFRNDLKPVENIAWTDAMEFCRRLTRQEATANHLPTGYVYSLPTEAQWEYAARAGDVDNGTGLLDVRGWFNDTGYGGTHAVGKKKANGWGLYDMNGNVWEWCLDFKAAYRPDPQSDPLVRTGLMQIIRGGSWKTGTPEGRNAFRGQAPRDSKRNDLGFRVALVPDPAVQWSR